MVVSTDLERLRENGWVYRVRWVKRREKDKKEERYLRVYPPLPHLFCIVSIVEKTSGEVVDSWIVGALQF